MNLQGNTEFLSYQESHFDLWKATYNVYYQIKVKKKNAVSIERLVLVARLLHLHAYTA